MRPLRLQALSQVHPQLFKAEGSPNLPPSWNLAPSQERAGGAAASRDRHPPPGRAALGTAAALHQGPKGRSEADQCSSGDSRLVRYVPRCLYGRRSIVPADLFYEWQKHPDGRKQPMAIAREDEAPLAFGGIWEGWKSPEGEVVRSFAIITTAANREMVGIHNRMPLVLEAADWPTWLGEEPGEAAALLRPAPDGTLRTWPVSTRVNSPRNNNASLIEPMVAEGEGGGPNSA